ncbi:MAG: WG repeat-containing protein [Sandaracinaceae bacterium]|nr:WG repeat-containing protein [Sandaracinaceae bacterium]
MHDGVFGSLTVAFESAAQKKEWLALPLEQGRAALAGAGIDVEDSELFGNEYTVKAKSLKDALATLAGMGLEVEKRDVATWAKVEDAGAPAIAIKTKGEFSEKTDAKAWLAWLKKHAKAGDTFYGVEDGAKRVAVRAYFDGFDAYANAEEAFSLALATATSVGATATLGFVGDMGMLEYAVYRGIRGVKGNLAGTRFDEPQNLTEALYAALLEDHAVDPPAIRAAHNAWLDTHVEKKLLMERAGNAGFMRPDGTFLVEPRYGALGTLTEGRAWFRDRSLQWGYLDEQGAVAIPAKFFQAHDFRGGLARVRFETERVVLSETSARMTWKHGFIDPSGTFVIPPVHDAVEDFAGDRAMVTLDGKYGYLDRSGALVIPATHDFGTSFSEGLALVCVGDRYAGGRWGFIDPSGAFVIEPTLVSAGAFMGGLAPSKTRRSCGGPSTRPAAWWSRPATWTRRSCRTAAWSRAPPRAGASSRPLATPSSRPRSGAWRRVGRCSRPCTRTERGSSTRATEHASGTCGWPRTVSKVAAASRCGPRPEGPGATWTCRASG